MSWYGWTRDDAVGRVGCTLMGLVALGGLWALSRLVAWLVGGGGTLKL